MDVSALTASMGVEIAVVFVKQTHSRNGISRRAGLRRNPFSVLPAPRAQGPPEQGARNYKEEQQDKAKGRRGTTTKAGAAAQSWELGAEQQEHQLSTQHASSAARRLRLQHLRMPGTPTKNRALSEPPSQGNSPAELAVLVLVPAICPLGCFQLALRALVAS